MDTLALAKIKKKLRLNESTPHTISSWEKLDAQLATIRETKVAYDHEENAIGISALAVALRSPSGELAAISIPVPTQRFEEKQAHLKTVLLRYVGALQEKLNR